MASVDQMRTWASEDHLVSLVAAPSASVFNRKAGPSRAHTSCRRHQSGAIGRDVAAVDFVIP
jgi:hypothetical protein